jgi:hypothetical protein
VVSCSGLWFWYVRRQLRFRLQNFGPFCFYFGCMPQRLYVITKSKDYLFLYTSKQCVLYYMIYCIAFLNFRFPWNIWSFGKKNCRLAIDGPPQGSLNGTLDHSWNRAFHCTLPVLYKGFYLLFKC